MSEPHRAGGRCYEDFEVGMVIRHPLGRSVSATDNTWFTLLTQNTNPIHFSMLKARYPVFGYFDDFVLSYQVGALKPDAEIYRKAIQRAGCRPDECFFTDDIAINVDAARENGMDAVQFLSAAQLEEELKTRGVL